MERTKSTSSGKVLLIYSPSLCLKIISTGQTGRIPMWNAHISTPGKTELLLDLQYTDQWTSKSTTNLDKLLSRKIRFVIHYLLLTMELLMSANIVSVAKMCAKLPLFLKTNPCENNGECGEGSLCLIKPGGQQRMCSCPEHFYPSVDKK